MDKLSKSQNISDSNGERRVPKCTKCRNHKIVALKKGHKGLCRFEDCNCVKCRVIDERRQVMKDHIRIRRQLEKEEKRQKIKEIEETLNTTKVESLTFPEETITLPSIYETFGPLIYSVGSQSISEASQQSWGSVFFGQEFIVTEVNNSLEMSFTNE